jgi:hypothetical protein
VESGQRSQEKVKTRRAARNSAGSLILVLLSSREGHEDAPAPITPTVSISPTVAAPPAVAVVEFERAEETMWGKLAEALWARGESCGRRVVAVRVAESILSKLARGAVERARGRRERREADCRFLLVKRRAGRRKKVRVA